MVDDSTNELALLVCGLALFAFFINRLIVYLPHLKTLWDVFIQSTRSAF